MFLDPDYIRVRLERCRDLANRAKNPELRTIHLAHVQHYQRMLECSVITTRPSAP
jgi:hypothetical protein